MTAMAILFFTVIFYFISSDCSKFMKSYLNLKYQMARIEHLNRVLDSVRASEHLDFPLSEELSDWVEKEVKAFLEEENAKEET